LRTIRGRSTPEPLEVSEGLRLLLSGVLGAALAFAAVPVAIAVARRTGFLDAPSGYKAHLRPTPYLGGAAVLAAAAPVVVLLGDGATAALWPLLVGAVGLAVVGTVDDRLNLSPWLRVGLEVLAAWLLWANDLGWTFLGSDIANLLLTTFWVVGIVNAFNLMDNLDGAAAGVGATCAAGVVVLASLGNAVSLAVLATALLGALLGFLRFNLARPARIFLGDGGSMPLGFLLAGALMAAPMGELTGWATVAAAVLMVGLPVFDTTLVVVSRRRRGAAVFSGATDHTTHRLLAVAGTPRAVAKVLVGAQAALCAAAIGATQLGEAALIVTACAVLVLGATTLAVAEGPGWTPVSDDS
jgi:UDP-GlcNAc:undecaprenyl-phosphate GlcNAc-1-phosphate transferase